MDLSDITKMMGSGSESSSGGGMGSMLDLIGGEKGGLNSLTEMFGGNGMADLMGRHIDKVDL